MEQLVRMESSRQRPLPSSVNLTGLMVTKLDGSTKGGIAIATEAALQVPLKYVGFGEAIDDLAPFDGDGYITELLT